jgi:thymidylate kinase
MNKVLGHFFSFEGLDNSSNNSITSLVGRRLRDKGLNTKVLSRYSQSSLGLELDLRSSNDIFQRFNANHRSSSEIEAEYTKKDLLYANNMIVKYIQSQNNIILKEGFLYSFLAYNAAKLNLDMPQRNIFDTIEYLKKDLTDIILPNMTFYLDSPSDILLKRLNVRFPYISVNMEDLILLEKIRGIFESFVKNNPERIVSIDGSYSDPIKVSESISEMIVKRMNIV